MLPNIITLLWLFFDRLPYFECLLWTLNMLSNVITNSEHHPSIFPDFSAILWLFLDILLYLEMHPAPWKCSPTSLPTVSTMPQFFPIYLLFYSYFTFRVAPITIFGYAPWTLKVFDSESILQHYLTNSEHNHLMFSDFSFILLAFYIWKSTFFLIWKYSLNPQNVPQCYHQQWATLQAHHCKQQVLSSSLSQAASPLPTGSQHTVGQSPDCGKPSVFTEVQQ